MCNNIEISFMIKNNAQQFALYLSTHYTQDGPELSKKLHGKVCFTEINEKFQSQFCDMQDTKIKSQFSNFCSQNLCAAFSYQWFSKTKHEPILVC